MPTPREQHHQPTRKQLIIVAAARRRRTTVPNCNCGYAQRLIVFNSLTLTHHETHTDPIPQLLQCCSPNLVSGGRHAHSLPPPNPPAGPALPYPTPTEITPTPCCVCIGPPFNVASCGSGCGGFFGCVRMHANRCATTHRQTLQHHRQPLQVRLTAPIGSCGARILRHWNDGCSTRPLQPALRGTSAAVDNARV